MGIVISRVLPVESGGNDPGSPPGAPAGTLPLPSHSNSGSCLSWQCGWDAVGRVLEVAFTLSS